MPSDPQRIANARSLRKSPTKAELLLWSLLRSRQLCGLKFRRQHPVEPFYGDFACVSHRVVVEQDGEYHEHIAEADLQRQRYLEGQGWKVIRFSNAEVFSDAEAVARAIVKQLGLPYSFRKRTSKRSGSRSEHAPHHKQAEN